MDKLNTNGCIISMRILTRYLAKLDNYHRTSKNSKYDLHIEIGPIRWRKFQEQGAEKKKLEDLGEILLKKIDRPEPFYGGDRPVSCIPHGGVWGSPGDRTLKY